MNSQAPGFQWNESKTQTATFENGTKLPLNIDLKKATIKDYGPVENLGKFYEKKEAEPILSSNTGYIVGTLTTSRATPRLRHQETNQNNGNLGIHCSIFEQDTGKAIATRELFSKPSSFSLFYCDTISSIPGTYRIKDSDNSETNFRTKNNGSDKKDLADLHLLGKYENVKKDFIEMLNDGTTDNQIKGGIINLNGLLFNSISESDTTPDNSSNLFKGGINFSTSSNGVLTAVVGTFSSLNDSHCFYDFYKVDKTSKTKKRIFKVYYNERKNDSKCTFSSDEKITEKGYELKIDLKRMRSKDCLLDPRCAYYIEIPLNKGDYFMTSQETSVNKHFPYILYLDIGANAGGALGTKVDRTIVYELLEQINESFTYPSGVAIVDFDNAVEDAKKLAIAIGSTYSGSITMKYAGNNQAQVTLNSSNTDTGVAYFDPNLTINGGDITSSQVHESIQTLETQRLTYFDYNKETKIINVLTFSQTRETSSSKWGDTKRKDYQSGEGNTDFKQTDNPLTIYGDDGKSTDTLPSITGYEKINKNTNVFQMKILRPLVTNSLDIDWKPMGTIPTEEDAPNYYFTIKGYDFVAKENNMELIDSDYSIIKNPNYGLVFNGKTIQEK